MELSQFGHGLAAGGAFVLATWAAAEHRPELVFPAVAFGAFLAVLAAMVRSRR